MPRKFPIIVIMFDDGRKSVYENALPIMEKYDIVGTNAIVTGNIGKSGAITWEQITLLDTLYHWETASHTYSHPHLNELNEQDFRFQMEKSLNDIKMHNLKVNTLAIPYGTIREEQYEVAAEYYKNIRNSTDIHFSLPINSKFLGCYTVHNQTTVSQIKDRILSAQENNEPLLIILFHDIGKNPSEYSYPPENFEKVLYFIHSNRFRTATLNNALTILNTGD